MVVKGRVDVRLNGLQQLETDFTRMSKLGDAGKQEYLQILATVFLEALVKFAPVNTGRYIRSWRVISQQQNRIIVGPARTTSVRRNSNGTTSDGISPRQLAVILEFSGARPHEIRPRGGDDILAFKWGGQEVWFSVVQHPGIKPQPHIRPALMETKRKAKGFAYAVAARYMPVQKWKKSMTDASRANGYQGRVPPRQTGRNTKDTSANITRGTKANIRSKLSVGLSGKRLRPRGLTRAVGSSESGLKAGRNAASRIQGSGLEKFR